MAGFLIAWFNVTGTFIVINLLIAASLIALSKLKQKPPIITAEKKTLEAVGEGLKYVLKTKELLAALSLDLFAVFFGGAAAMVPVYAKDILHVGPIGFGWLNAATDIGSICMVISLNVGSTKRKKQGLKLLFAVAGFGLSLHYYFRNLKIILALISCIISEWYFRWRECCSAQQYRSIKNTRRIAGKSDECKLNVH